jgi:hypothetical protein
MKKKNYNEALTLFEKSLEIEKLNYKLHFAKG